MCRVSNLSVFYGTQLYGEYASWCALWAAEHLSEIYNGAYVYDKDQPLNHWFTMDGCPVLIEDVPKELRLLALVLNP